MARYEFTDGSRVEIEAQSSVHPIQGETNGVRGEAVGEVEDGKILLDPQPSGYVEVPIDALQSGHRLQDMEMRRRLHAKKFPTIRYDLKEAKGGPERFQLTGELTFHGETRPLSEEVTARLDGDRLIVEGEHTFNIEDFGVKAPKILKLQVYPEVRVVAHLVAERA